MPEFKPKIGIYVDDRGLAPLKLEAKGVAVDFQNKIKKLFVSNGDPASISSANVFAVKVFLECLGVEKVNVYVPSPNFRQKYSLEQLTNVSLYKVASLELMPTYVSPDGVESSPGLELTLEGELAELHSVTRNRSEDASYQGAGRTQKTYHTDICRIMAPLFEDILGNGVALNHNNREYVISALIHTPDGQTHQDHSFVKTGGNFRNLKNIKINEKAAYVEVPVY